MGFGYSVFSSELDIIFKHKGPSGNPKKVFKMFDKENGLLFRLIMANGQWAFYNDTKGYEFHVRYTFDGDTNVEPLGDTTLTVLENGSVVAELIIYPLETRFFIDGEISTGYGRVEAQPLSERYKRERIKEKLQQKKYSSTDYIP